MARFSIEVALKLLGENVRAIEAEFKKVGTAAQRELEKISRSSQSLDQQLKGLKAGVKGYVSAFMLLDGAKAAVEALDTQFHFLNDTTRDMVDSLGHMGAAIRGLDVAGVAAGLGQFLGNAIAQTTENLRVMQGGMHELEQDLERQRNGAHRLAREGYDVLRMSVEQIDRAIQDMATRRRDLAGAILGDPGAMRQQAEQTVRDLVDVIKRQGQGMLNPAELKNAKEVVQGQLDALEKYGTVAPPALLAVAGAWGVVSTEAEKAGEKQKQAAERAAEAVQRATATARKAMADQQQRQDERHAQNMHDLRNEAIEKWEEHLDGVRKKTLENVEAQRQWNAALDAAKIVDLGKLREEVEWEKKRIVAMLEGKDALAAWTAAKARADYVANSGATGKLADEYEALALELEKLRAKTNEWAETQKQIAENLIRGLQSAMSGFFQQIFEGNGKDALKSFGDALKGLLINAVSEWLAAWVMAQAKALAASLKRIATEKAAQQAASGTDIAGSASGTKTSTGDIVGAGQGVYGQAGWGGLIAAAAVAVFAVWAKGQKDRNAAKSYGTFGTQVGVDYVRGGISVTEGAKQMSKDMSMAMRNLLAGFQTMTGSFVTGMDSVTIIARNDGKRFRVQMGDVVLGYVDSMEEAVLMAFTRGLSTADWDRALAPAVADILRTAEARFKSIDELMKAVETVQGLHDLAAGVSELERAMRTAMPQFEQLERQLIEWGVSAGEAVRLSGAALLDQLTGWRDEITGRQRTHAEEMKLRQQQAAMFNAQVILVRAELELRRQELLARLGMLRGVVGTRPDSPTGTNTGGGPTGTGGGGPRHPTIDASTAAARASSGIMTAAFRAQVQMYGVWAKATTTLTRQTLGSQVALTTAASQLIDQQVSALMAQINAIDQILANLPNLIGMGEIRVGGGRGGGRGRGGGSGSQNTGGFWEQMIGDQSYLSHEDQLRVARQRYEQLRARAASGGADARAAFEAFAERYGEEVRSYFGATAAGAEIFEEIMRDLSRYGAGNDQERQARQQAIRNIYDLASASAAAARILNSLGLGGGNNRAGSNPGSRPGASNSNLSMGMRHAPTGFAEIARLVGGSYTDAAGGGAVARTVQLAGGGFGNSDVVDAIRSGSSRSGEQLGRVATAIERQNRKSKRRGRRGGSDGDDPGSPPPPPPPPTYERGHVGPRFEGGTRNAV